MGAAQGGRILCPLAEEAAWRVPALEVPHGERSLLCGLACRCVERRCVELGEQELGTEVAEVRREAEEAVGPAELRMRRLPPLSLEDVFQDDVRGDALTPTSSIAPVLLGSPAPRLLSGLSPLPLDGTLLAEAGSPKNSQESARTSISLTSSTDRRAAPVKGLGSPPGRRASARELGATASPQKSLCWRPPASPKVIESRPDFGGHWVCQSTWGLDPFLRELGVSKLQRVALERAPWPTWEFQQDGNYFVFLNHSILGCLREEFEAGGAEYQAVDGRRQLLQCRAFWEDCTLVLEKSGPPGRFREERFIDDDGVLRFTLRVEGASGACFGRSFERRQARLFC